MKVKFIPLDYDYVIIKGDTYMKIFGRTSDNKSACIIDKPKNFFYVLSKNPEKLLGKIPKE